MKKIFSSSLLEPQFCKNKNNSFDTLTERQKSLIEIQKAATKKCKILTISCSGRRETGTDPLPLPLEAGDGLQQRDVARRRVDVEIVGRLALPDDGVRDHVVRSL